MGDRRNVPQSQNGRYRENRKLLPSVEEVQDEVYAMLVGITG
jgi:hypothetical protein